MKYVTCLMFFGGKQLLELYEAYSAGDGDLVFFVDARYLISHQSFNIRFFRVT